MGQFSLDRRAYRLHHLPEVGLSLEADAGRIGQGHAAVFDRAIVGEAAERGEDVKLAFVAAEPEPYRDECELVPAMRHAVPTSRAGTARVRRYSTRP
jgi:hypothetical protein